MRCEAACADVDCAWGCHSAAALLEHISLRVIAILFVRSEKLVSVEDEPSAPLHSLREEDKYPCMRMVLDLMGN